MKKAYEDGLKTLFPRMVHITCVCHGLHNVADHVRKQFPLVDKYIANCKKISRKSPKNLQYFRSFAPTLPIPPRPVITRWGTWLEACTYYQENMEVIAEIIPDLPSECAAVNIVKEILKLNRPQLESQLVFLTVNYNHLVEGIAKLQQRLTLGDSLNCMEKIEETLQHEEGKLKLKAVLDKNSGLKELKAVRNIIKSGAAIADGMRVGSRTAKKLASAVNAPIVSCDAERSFSAYGDIVTNQRSSLTQEHIKELTFCYCN